MFSFKPNKSQLLALLVALLAAAAVPANASIIKSKLHYVRALQDAVADDDFIGDSCLAEQTAIEKCTGLDGTNAGTGTCTEECVDNAFPEPDDDPFGGQGEPDFTNMEEFNAAIGTFNENLAGLCSSTKDAACTITTDCCPDCGAEIKALLDCTLVASKDALEGMTGEAMGLLANLTGAEIPPITLDCDLKEHTCDGGGGGSSTPSGANTIPLASSMVIVALGLLFRLW